MASTLSIRQSLLWKTVIDDFCKSPYFELTNCMCQLIIRKYTGLPDAYEIVLKKSSKSESFQVTTFLEDRRSNDTTYCSTLTGSSDTEEVLYRASSDSMFPGIKTYRDLIVVCEFCPSTKLTLLGDDSSLSIRQSLVWNAEKPTKMEHSISPSFTLMNSSWRLGIQLFNSTEDCPAIFEICLKNSDKGQSFQPFEVKVLLQDRRNDAQIHCSKINVSSNFEILHREYTDSIYERLPALKIYNDVNVICVFSPSTELKL